MLTKPGNKHHEDHWNRKGHELNIQSGYQTSKLIEDTGDPL